MLSLLFLINISTAGDANGFFAGGCVGLGMDCQGAQFRLGFVHEHIGLTFGSLFLFGIPFPLNASMGVKAYFVSAQENRRPFVAFSAGAGFTSMMLVARDFASQPFDYGLDFSLGVDLLPLDGQRMVISPRAGVSYGAEYMGVSPSVSVDVLLLRK